MTRVQVLNLILATSRRRGWDAGRNGKPRPTLDGQGLCALMAREAGERLRVAEITPWAPRISQAYADGFAAGAVARAKGGA